MTGGKPSCILLTSCIGAVPRFLLPYSEAFGRRYVFSPMIYDTTPGFVEMQKRAGQEIDNAAALIYHPAEILQYPPDVIEAYEELLASVPDSVDKVAIGQPHFHAFWPFHANDPRNDDASRKLNRFGSLPFYHYGDSFVLKLFKQGLSRDEAFERYLHANLADEVDLDRTLEYTLSLLGRHDSHCSVKVQDFVASNFRERALFQSINHGNVRMMWYITNGILRTLGCDEIPASFIETTQEIIGEAVPIHPSILRYFNVSFLDENSRYILDYRRNLTFAEYLRDYVDFRDGILGSPPQRY